MHILYWIYKSINESFIFLIFIRFYIVIYF